MTKKVHIKTFGCEMNQYDSNKIAELLKEKNSFIKTNIEEEADLIVFNTCSIREKAEDKVYSELGKLQRLKNKNPDLKIAVGGCVASQEGEKIIKKAPYVNFVFGPQTLHRLPELISKEKLSGKSQVDITFPTIEKFDSLSKPSASGISASVSIMEGCSKYCSFCVVPYTRGEEISRSLDSILQEVIELTQQGVIEINLLGQNVNAYRSLNNDGIEIDFADLIEYISQVDEVKRIRFTTSHPNEMNDNLIECFANNKKLAKFIHLPIQSGSDKVLMGMKRNYTFLEYKSIIKKLQKACPGICVSSDFIIGFPGETVADHNKTIKAIKEIFFDYSYSFIYSPRPGTPAAYLDDDTSQDDKKARLAEIQKILLEQGSANTKKMIGSIQRVLFDQLDQEDNTFKGKSDNNRIIKVKTQQNILNQMLNVQVSSFDGKYLHGEIV
jgi:tRNA-2-methylthio-N6-dimethylallyladenosine synthase